MPFTTLRTSPSASISSLAQLEALTRNIPCSALQPSSRARKRALNEQPEVVRDSQASKQSNQRKPKAGLSRTNSWWTIGTGEEFSEDGEVVVTPAESTYAYETEGWEGDDERDDDDNDTDILEEKMIEAQEVATLEAGEDGDSHKGSTPAEDLTVVVRIPEEPQVVRPVIPVVSAEESRRSSASTKKKGRVRAGKSSHSWAWRCFLWCCVVERIRGRG